MAGQRDRAAKDVEWVRVIKDKDGKVLMSEEFGEKWKEYFDELMNVENERRRRRDGSYIRKCRGLERSEGSCEDEEWKVVSPDDIPVEAWRCLGERAVGFLTQSWRVRGLLRDGEVCWC